MLIFSVSLVDAAVLVKTKDGKVLKWKNYTTEENDYCTLSPVGKFCIPKDSVISISGENEGYIQERPEEIAKRKKEKEQYLKEKEKEQADWQIKENLTRIKENEQKRVEALNSCLKDSSDRYQQEWDGQCAKKGFEPKCPLPSSAVLVLDQRFRDSKEDCYRAFK